MIKLALISDIATTTLRESPATNLSMRHSSVPLFVLGSGVRSIFPFRNTSNTTSADICRSLIRRCECKVKIKFAEFFEASLM